MAIFVPNLRGSTQDFRRLTLSAITAKMDFPELAHFFLGGGGGSEKPEITNYWYWRDHTR